mgnify:CR=1 FL=1
MDEDQPYIHTCDQGYALCVWVQPGAKRTEIAGVYQGYVKIRLKAPPVDNKANKQLIAYLANILHIKPRQIHLQSGQGSRKKVLRLEMAQKPDLGLI